MKAPIDCRAMEMMCRKRALADKSRRWEWEAHAERWHDVGHQEVARRFQKNNAASTTARQCGGLVVSQFSPRTPSNRSSNCPPAIPTSFIHLQRGF